MQIKPQLAVHPRHAELVADLRDYLRETGRSARWLGIVTANNPRLLPGLIRGQSYPAAVMIALCERLVSHYERRLAAEPLAA